jgi:hypothetical protein
VPAPDWRAHGLDDHDLAAVSVLHLIPPKLASWRLGFAPRNGTAR